MDILELLLWIILETYQSVQLDLLATFALLSYSKIISNHFQYIYTQIYMYIESDSTYNAQHMSPWSTA